MLAHPGQSTLQAIDGSRRLASYRTAEFPKFQVTGFRLVRMPAKCGPLWRRCHCQRDRNSLATAQDGLTNRQFEIRKLEDHHRMWRG
jgi:hypothetical protein